MLRSRFTDRPFHALLGALCAALLLPAAVNARSPGVKTLTAVDFRAAAEHVEFTVRTDPPLAPDAVSARRDGAVLMIQLDDVAAERRWLETDDAAIARTLLHPSRKYAPAAIVRVRMKRKVGGVMLENIRVRAEGDAVVIAVPRSAAVARAWARAPAAEAPAPTADAPMADAPASAVKLTFGPPTRVAPPAEPTLEPPPAIAAAPDALDDAPAPAAAEEPFDPADTPLALGDDAPLDTPTGDVALSAGLARVSGPGIGAFLMSLLFLGAVGFLMWRKMRGSRATPTGRPLIRPVGSHMLGPKQSLLLVDVAGEMVLLGTTDKGVQMLTKIEGRDEPDPAVTPGPAVPREALGPVAGHFAERLGAAVSRFRTAAARLGTRTSADDGPAAPPAPAADDRAARERAADDRAAERRFFAREKDALREAAEEDALAALAERVEDTPEIDPRRLARTRFAPVEPAEPERPAAPTLDPRADLLRKIRELQRA